MCRCGRLKNATSLLVFSVQLGSVFSPSFYNDPSAVAIDTFPWNNTLRYLRMLICLTLRPESIFVQSKLAARCFHPLCDLGLWGREDVIFFLQIIIFSVPVWVHAWKDLFSMKNAKSYRNLCFFGMLWNKQWYESWLCKVMGKTALFSQEIAVFSDLMSLNTAEGRAVQPSELAFDRSLWACIWKLSRDSGSSANSATKGKVA